MRALLPKFDKRMILSTVTAVSIATAMMVAAAPAQARPMTPPALCGCGDMSPFSVGTDSGGADFVFYASNGQLWEKWSNDAQSTWYGPQVIKAAGTSQTDPQTPAVAVHPNGGQDVFWEDGNTNDLDEISYTPGKGWGTVKDLGGPGPGLSGFFGMSAGSDSHGNDYVFYASNLGALMERWTTGAGTSAGITWHGPSYITDSGAITYGPATAVHPDGQQDVFWMKYTTNTVANIYDDRWANGKWTLKNLGVTTDVPASASWLGAGADSNDNAYVFWENPSAGPQTLTLQEIWRYGTTWHGGSMGAQILTAAKYGFFSAGPSVAVHPDGVQDVFWYDGTGATPVLEELSYSDGAWRGPVSRGGF